MNKENSDPNGNDNQAQAQDEFGAEGRHELLTGGKRRSTLNRNHVASVLPISPILDSQRLPATPNRSFKICCFIGENDDFDGITALQKRDGAVEWIRTTKVLLPPAGIGFMYS